MASVVQAGLAADERGVWCGACQLGVGRVLHGSEAPPAGTADMSGGWDAFLRLRLDAPKAARVARNVAPDPR